MTKANNETLTDSNVPVISDFVLRMIGEFKELDDRTTKLGIFIADNPVYQSLVAEEQDLMKVQQEGMLVYSNALKARLERIGVTSIPDMPLPVDQLKTELSELSALVERQKAEILDLTHQLAAKTITDQNILEALSLIPTETNSRVVIDYVLALVAEGVAMRSGATYFSYGTDAGYEEHPTAEQAREAAKDDIDGYRDEAIDGWSDEVSRVVWGVVLERSTMTGLSKRTDEDSADKSIEEICDYELQPEVETPATVKTIADIGAKAITEAAFSYHEKAYVAFEGSAEPGPYIRADLQQFAASWRIGK